jgi:selenocysteine-specific elongation factor
MRSITIGTAGHIDHGKTQLVKALTGIDCDRWVQEKARGITIDLGFAHLEIDDFQLGFVDVPGHEKFLHNALAGLGGIRLVLLVVAADEGVKPQTREHLAICSLLEIPHAVVALTKCDLVTPDLLELAQLELEEILSGTHFGASPVLPVSSLTGMGIPELKQTLLDIASQLPENEGGSLPARLPIDRAFHLKGLGSIVTGTMLSGSVRVSDSLALQPGSVRPKVRSIQVHGEARDQAVVGERVAMQLSNVSLNDVARGMHLSAPDMFLETKSLIGRFQLLADVPKKLSGVTTIRFHHFTGETIGRIGSLSGKTIDPGASDLVEIRLAQPIVAKRGDRFIIRRPSPPATLGGGKILDPSWIRRRGVELKGAITAFNGDSDQLFSFWVREGSEAGIEAQAISSRLGLPSTQVKERLQALVQSQKLLYVPQGQGHGERWLSPGAYKRIEQRTAEVLKEYFKTNRLAQGMPKAEAIRRILPGRASALAATYLQWLASQKVLVVQGDLVSLPDRRVTLSGQESALSEEILRSYEAAGLKPPSPGELQRDLGAKPQILEGVMKFLFETGKLVRLPGDLFIAAAAIQRIVNDLTQPEVASSFTVGEFKTMYGLSRKWAIPILEHLDSAGVTRRVGDQRQVVKKS